MAEALFRPEAFEPLTGDAWDSDRARAGIRRIVADADAALRGPRLLWPAEPWDAWRSTRPLKNLYVGAAGVLWALDALRRRGHAETGLDLAALGLAALERMRTRPDFQRGIPLPEPAAAGLLSGEAGILLVAHGIAPDDALAEQLRTLVRANEANAAEDVMWGTPGTLLAARAMLERTGLGRWRAACRAGRDALLGRRDGDGLWCQRLYGEEYRGLGPAHGLVGNLAALLPLVDAHVRAGLIREANVLLAREAVLRDGLANWPVAAGRRLTGGDGEIRVQWCAGAPGIVVTAGAWLEPELLLAGAALPWRTGPPGLAKGPGICHGTAGHGYAFLAAFARTGDERWLERARRFAIHALGQVERLRATRGRGRYSLFTGDLGVAVYVADCLEARAAYPVLGAS